jgi:hypothetical protein
VEGSGNIAEKQLAQSHVACLSNAEGHSRDMITEQTPNDKSILILMCVAFRVVFDNLKFCNEDCGAKQSGRLFSFLTHLICYYSVRYERCHIRLPPSARIHSLVNSKQNARKELSNQGDVTCVEKSSGMRISDITIGPLSIIATREY